MKNPEIVPISHDAKKALARMNASGVNYVCVVDGDIIVGVLSRCKLDIALAVKSDCEIRTIMDRSAFVMDIDVGERAAATLRASGAPYVLLVDNDSQLHGILERPAPPPEPYAA